MKKQLLKSFFFLVCWSIGLQAFSQVFSSGKEYPSYQSIGRAYISKALKKGSNTFHAFNETYTNNASHVMSRSYLMRNDTVIFTSRVVSGSTTLEYRDFIVDDDGSVYLVGHTPVPIIFLEGQPAITGSFVVRINTSGYASWARVVYGDVKSIVSYDTKLLIMTDINGPVIYNYNKSNGTNNGMEYQLASGTAKAGKMYSDGTLFYFTFTFTLGTVRVIAASNALTNAGGTDAVLVKYNPLTKSIYWAHHIGTSKNEQINDLTFNGNEVYFIGTTNTNGANNDAFLTRETSAPSQGGRYYVTNVLANASNNEGIAVSFNANEGKVYALYQTRGNHSLGGTTVTNRTNFDDLLVVGYTAGPANMNHVMTYSSHARLFGIERTIGGDLITSGTSELTVFGASDGELTASDNSGTRVLINPNTYYYGFSAKLSTATCPVVIAPTAIDGPSNFCQNVPVTFTISPVAGASSYTWTKPTGWTGTSTSTSITLTPNATAGSITVRANNACGNSSGTRSKTLTSGGAPLVPTAINGSTTVCPNKTAVYTADTVSGATSYVWTLPSGWVGTSTTASITVTTGTTGGTISVSARNACGTSTARTLSVLTTGAAPAQPEPIIGNLAVCKNSTATFSIPPVKHATSYIWTVTSGGGLTGTSTSTSIDYNILASAVDSRISVRAVNSCGTGVEQFANIIVQSTVPAAAGSITGYAASLCPGIVQTATTPLVQGQTYSWSISDPSYSYVESSPNNAIQFTTGNRTATISVTPINACGVGPTTSNQIVVQIPPAPTVSGTPEFLCLSSPTATNIFASATGGALYEWVYSTNITAQQFTTQLSFSALNYGTDSIAYIAVRAKGNCGWGDYTYLSIPIKAKPAQPSAIVGSQTPPRNVATTYSVTNDLNATSYNWTGSGATIVGTTNEVQVSFSSSTSLIAMAVNACGTSEGSFLSVSPVQDLTAPTIASLSPVNNATNVSVSANLVLTFSEPVVKVADKLVQVVRVSGDVVVGNYTTDSPEITISGNTLTINPSFNFEPNTQYYVYMANGTVKDAANNFFTGMTNSNFWKFTTTPVTGLEVNELTTVLVAPNPFTTSIQLSIPEGGATVHVFDMKGQLIESIQAVDSQVTIGENWNAGMYQVHIASSKLNQTLKVVKQ